LLTAWKRSWIGFASSVRLSVCLSLDLRPLISSSDRIVVIDKGVIAECGRPGDLLANPASRFAALLSEAKRQGF
jgi:ABC-type multidrug transport system fused ATPase/permease subunit